MSAISIQGAGHSIEVRVGVVGYGDQSWRSRGAQGARLLKIGALPARACHAANQRRASAGNEALGRLGDAYDPDRRALGAA